MAVAIDNHATSRWKRRRHHDLAAHQQARGANQRRAGNLLRIGRIDPEFDRELTGRMLDGDGLDAAGTGATSGPTSRHSRADRHRRQHADRVVADVRNEAAVAIRVAAGRSGTSSDTSCW